MSNIFNAEFFGNTVKDWFMALIFIIGGFAAGILGYIAVHKSLHEFCKKLKLKSDFNKVVEKQIKAPFILLFVSGGIALALDKLTMNEVVEYWEDKILSCIFIFLSFWAVIKFLDAIIKYYIPEVDLDDANRSTQSEFKNIVRKVVTTVLWIIPLALILNNLGYNISAILAGLGIGGAAIALASKDTLSNFFGSISVFVDKPFHLSDQIKLIAAFNTTYEGQVIDMGLRVSRIRTSDNRIITIPNSYFTQYPIQNISAEPHTKITEIINIRSGLGYEKTRAAVSILQNIKVDNIQFGALPVASLSEIDFTPQVTLSSSQNGVFKITFTFYIAKNENRWQTINAVNLEIVRLYEEAGIFTPSEAGGITI